MTGAELLDAAGAAVPFLDGRWVVEEAQRYELRVASKCAARLNERPLDWQPDLRGFAFKLPFAVGQYRLELDAEGTRTVFPLTVQPAATKLSATHWEAMLSDLDAWLPGLLTGAEGAAVGHVGTQGVAAPLAAVALIPLLGQLERALLVVIDRPRTLDLTHLEDVPLHRTRRATRESLAWLSRHPAAAQWLDVDHEEGLTGPPPMMPQRVAEDTRDHPANRYVAWLMGQVCRRLRVVAEELDTVKGHDLNETVAWARPRAVALRRGSERLERLVRQSFLGDLQPEPASGAALLVVQDHPCYARLHRLGRRFLSALFTWSGEGPSAPTRPSFELYELWCFLALWRVLQRALPTARWTQHNLGKLLALTPGHTGARLRADWCGGTVSIHFNPTFRSVLSGIPKHGRWSLSRERRPDLTVSWQRADHSAWVCLDAKYRAGPSNLADALASVHIYRDSLRWKDLGGPCQRAALLAPRQSADCALWFSRSFRDAHGFGIWQLRPGTPLPPELADWLLESLAIPMEVA